MSLVSSKSFVAASMLAAAAFAGTASAATQLSYYNSDTRNNSFATPSPITNAAALDAAGLDGSLNYHTGPGDVAPNNKVAVTFYKPDGGGVGTPTGAVLGTLGALDQISFDYLVTGLTPVAPAVRLKLSPNGTSSATYVDLVWEPAYNGGSTNNIWFNDVNVDAGSFWQRSNGVNHDGNDSLGNPNSNGFQPLSAWAGGFNPAFNGPGVSLNASTPIYGVEVSLGSGLPNNFDAYIDDVQISFTGGDSYTGNVAVPEPTGLGLLALGGVALLGRRGRRTAKQA